MQKLSYPSLARLIFNDNMPGRNHGAQVPSKQTTQPGYMKKAITIKNPKIAANIELMFSKWKPSTVTKAAASATSISTLKMLSGQSRKVIRARYATN